MTFSRQLDKILRGKVWRFFGGLKPDGRKSTSDTPIEELTIPSIITLPLDRHLGPDGEILVQVGDYVKAGQMLTNPGGKKKVPLHASTSGYVTAINMQVLPHPSGFLGRCITIKPDGKDAAVPPEPMLDWQERSPEELLERIRNYGVEGLGGAQFQTAVKIAAALEEAPGDCNIFIVNGAECEPVATCDDRLMQEKAEEIALGIEVVRHILKPKAIIVAIEDNKPKAIEAMQKAVASDVMVRVIPSIYPSGAARNLIKICTGIEIPYNEHTSECGIVVDNVETVFAIKQAVVDGLPLIKRVITVDGKTLGRKGNALVRLGTSVRFVLNAYKLNPERRQRIILGGPFMGFTLPTIDVPLTKSATCIFVPSHAELPEEQEPMNCIRCGRCARVCPSRLVPYQLYALSRAGQHKKTKSCGMMDCTECGCCSYVCPSRIPLTGQFRKEKNIIRLVNEQQWRNERAQERMAARKERLEKEEKQKAARRAAALARVQAQQEQNDKLSFEELAAKRAAAVQAARERAAAKRAQARAASTVSATSAADTATDAAASSSSAAATAARRAALVARARQAAAQRRQSQDQGQNAEAEATSVLASTEQAQAKAHDMMQHANKEGMLVAAMMAQGGTSALIKEQEEQRRSNLAAIAAGTAPLNAASPAATVSDTDAAVVSAGGTAPENGEKLPYALRKAAVQKHAAPIFMWPAVEEQPNDMSKVENPPEAGMVIPESRPRTKTYLQAPTEVQPTKAPLPSRLRRADYVPPVDADAAANSDSTAPDSNEQARH